MRASFTLTLLLLSTEVIAAPAPLAKPDRDAGKVKAARKAVVELSGWMDTYKFNHGDYPTSINALTELDVGNCTRPVTKEALIDPWGRPYEIDPNGPKNKGLLADVFSRGRNPKDPKAVIGNWQEFKSRKRPAITKPVEFE